MPPLAPGTSFVASPEELEAALLTTSHTIVIAEGVHRLTQTININRSVTLQGQTPGRIVLDGQRVVRVLDVNGASGSIDVSVEGLNISNGYAVSAP